MQGQILSGSKNTFEVECQDGITRDCTFKGKIFKASTGYYNPLAPGDFVCLDEKTLEQTKGLITDLVPRKNEFVRWNIKKRQPQLLAANLNYLLIVTTPDEPPFRPRFIDRALAQAEYQGIEPVIICNKYDLFTDDNTAAAAESSDTTAPKIQHEKNALLKAQLTAWENIGYKVIRTSARTGQGLSELAALIQNKLSAFVGQSGVGKSSIINALDKNLVLRTGSLSQKYGRGTHTTTQGTLLHLQYENTGTADIIDTPGVRRFLLHDITWENLALYYRDFTPYIGKCNFGMSCSHNGEKGCAICKAVEDGKISSLRYESWLRVAEELKTGSFED